MKVAATSIITANSESWAAPLKRTARCAPQVRPHRGDRAEDERHAKLYAALPPVLRGTEEARQPDHDQACGDGLLRAEARGVDQNRNGEYGSAAAKEAEREAHHYRQQQA